MATKLIYLSILYLTYFLVFFFIFSSFTGPNLNSIFSFFPVMSLYELCAHSIVKRTTVYGIDRLPLPTVVRQSLKSYAMTSPTNASSLLRPGAHYKSVRSGGKGRRQLMLPNDDVATARCGPSAKKACVIA